MRMYFLADITREIPCPRMGCSGDSRGRQRGANVAGFTDKRAAVLLRIY